jgi:hypothetical protein
MRKPNNNTLSCSLLAGTLLLAGVAHGQNPYGDDQKVKKATTTSRTAATAAPVQTGITSEGLRTTVKQVETGNRYSRGQYRNYVLPIEIIQGTIVFTDDTKNYERISWFEQILSEHGCGTIKIDKKETKTGNILNRKKFMTVTAQVQGRGFVIKALKGYYGGTLAKEPAAPVAPNDASLQPIVALELENIKTEQSLLSMAFEVDRLIQQRQKLGAFDFSEKSRIDKALAELKDQKIPAAKAKLAAGHSDIVDKFIDLADRAMEKKDYQKALSLIEASGSTSEKAAYRTGTCYKNLAEYDKAIAKYQALTGSSYYGERVENDIADCYHLKGNDREALNALYRVLNGFHNTQEELAALARIDQWKLLNRAAEFPELAPKLSGIYIEKTFLDAAANRPLAVTDYKKAVDVLANGGNKAQASQQILQGYQNTAVQNQQSLSISKAEADKRFMLERERARGQVDAWRVSYDRSVTQARRDYDYELSDKRRQLNDAQRELDYLLRNRPANSGSGTGTDPYPDNSNSNTDPYSKKPTTGSSGSSNSGTDPYGTSSTTTKKTGTDPYAGSGNTNPYPDSGNTNPYPDSGNSTSEYDQRVSSLRNKIDRLDRDYRWLYANQTAYVDEKTRSEAASLDAARRELTRYDLTKKDAYISNDSQVKRYAQLTADSSRKYQSLAGIAREAGY